jgi:O-acetyl-ADP-ribose deacetylase (regulator of RNase III)
MPTSFVSGDIFNTAGVRAYAQGVSCAGTMDTGVAIAFKKRWPRMFDDYKAHCDDHRLALGDVLVFNEGDEVIYNLAIQEHWKKKATLPALNRALTKMIGLAIAAGAESVGIPRIGAGLGGLDWTRVKRVLNDVGSVTPLKLVVFEKFVRAPTV